LFYLVRISITHPIFASLGMGRYIFWRAVAALAINFSLTYFFIMMWGTIGAAVSTVLSVTLVYIFSNLPVMARVLNIKKRQVYPLGLVAGLLALWMGGGYLFKWFVADPLVGGAVTALNIGGWIGELITPLWKAIGFNKDITGNFLDNLLTTGFSAALYFIVFGLLCYVFLRPDYRWMGTQFGKVFDKIFGKLFKKQIARRAQAKITRKTALSETARNKLLYISFEPADDRSSGVNRKIAAQIKAFSDAGLDVTKIAQTSSGIVISNKFEEERIEYDKSEIRPVFRKLPFKLANRAFLCAQAARQAGEDGCVYMRFQFFSPDVLLMLKALKYRGANVVVEIPTYPYWRELVSQGRSGLVKLVCDRIFAGFCSNYIDVFTAPLYGNEISERPCISIMNGVDFSEIAVRNPGARNRRDKNEIHMLAVALMAPWHGYDRVIEGLARYKKSEKKTGRRVFLHLVGDGAEIPRYREMTEKMGLGGRVIFHGRLHGERLDEMYDMCDVSVSTLACHRKNMERDYREGSLKHIEAFAKGIPVVAAAPHHGPIKQSTLDAYLIGRRPKPHDPPTPITPFDMAVPEDDSPVDISRIVNFVGELRDKFTPDELAAKIRAAGEERYDIRVTQKGVVGWILSH
ncbi:MAG: glycosyltransferase, partial [Oscillospiraceae bacterium]|nr:glycosyltransferase [Oscillospiraceae bacterium]